MTTNYFYSFQFQWVHTWCTPNVGIPFMATILVGVDFCFWYFSWFDCLSIRCWNSVLAAMTGRTYDTLFRLIATSILSVVQVGGPQEQCDDFSRQWTWIDSERKVEHQMATVDKTWMELWISDFIHWSLRTFCLRLRNTSNVKYQLAHRLVTQLRRKILMFFHLLKNK